MLSVGGWHDNVAPGHGFAARSVVTSVKASRSVPGCATGAASHRRVPVVWF
jgi:hypothetical protein